MRSSSNAYLSPEEEAGLWQRHQQGDEQARAQLIERYRPLVPNTAWRAAPNLPVHLDREDLEGEALLALVKAVDSFDPHRGVKFTSYAIACIKGACREHLRKTDWVPRSVRSKERRGEEVEIIQVVSLEAIIGGDHGGQSADDPLTVLLSLADPSPSPFERVVEEQRVACLQAALSYLSRQDRRLLLAYFWEQRNHKEIAALLGRSESRVRQLYARSLARLRGFLDPARGWI